MVIAIVAIAWFPTDFPGSDEEIEIVSEALKSARFNRQFIQRVRCNSKVKYHVP